MTGNAGKIRRDIRGVGQGQLCSGYNRFCNSQPVRLEKYVRRMVRKSPLLFVFTDAKGIPCDYRTGKTSILSDGKR